jgi:calcium binding protein 39
MAEVCWDHLTAISELNRDLAGVAGVLTPSAPEVLSDDTRMSFKIRNCLKAVDGYLRAQVEDTSDSTSCEAQQALAEVLAGGMLAALVGCLGALDFETQKDAARLFCALLRLGTPVGMDVQIATYVDGTPEVLEMLLEGLATPDLALHCAQMLISCARSDALTAALFRGGVASRLIQLAQNPNFDIASEAYSVLRELLLAQKASSAKFVEANFDNFFGSFHKLLEVPNYVAQRQALKLLGTMLLDRPFKDIMIQYVTNERFLQIHMNLLRHNSKAMQIAEFHIFKIFVAMPRKPYRVQQILYRNKEKLLCLLDTFQSAAEQNTGFASDLQATLHNLTQLEAPGRSPSACRPDNVGLEM